MEEGSLLCSAFSFFPAKWFIGKFFLLWYVRTVKTSILNILYILNKIIILSPLNNGWYFYTVVSFFLRLSQLCKVTERHARLLRDGGTKVSTQWVRSRRGFLLPLSLLRLLLGNAPKDVIVRVKALQDILFQLWQHNKIPRSKHADRQPREVVPPSSVSVTLLRGGVVW